MSNGSHVSSSELPRFRQMRWTAKYHGKSVPSMEELRALLPPDMCCPCCGRPMNWRAAEGRSTMITLQHDRNGAHQLICHACNSRHAKGKLWMEIRAEELQHVK